MANIDHQRLADGLVPAVVAAGAAILRHRTPSLVVTHKADRSPVTAADQEAEDILLAALARLAPNVQVVAEEAVSRHGAPVPAAAFFLVDALDGTREFVANGTDFTVNVGLVADGAPAFGVVYAPVLGRLFVTVAPHRVLEARMPAGANASSLAAFAPREVRTRAPDPGRLVAVTSRSHNQPETERFLDTLPIAERRRVGSSIKFCLVACGEADVYPRSGTINEWDTAAGHAVLEAAGGVVRTFAGEPLRYAKPDYRNPGFVAWGRAPRGVT
jgi:3'(2'),5'-bisphosphate nucleotidase